MCAVLVDKITGAPLPTRKSVQQLRWFESSFRARMGAVSAQTGIRYVLNDRRLVDAFLEWHRAFDSQKPASRMVRRAYVGFAAGMMFHELLRKRPASAQPARDKTDADDPSRKWPEEYLYASYCHVIRQAILGQEFWLDTDKPDRLDDAAIWNGFSDRSARDRTAAISFFDLFSGESRSGTIPAKTGAHGGFGERLWTLAAVQGDADRTDRQTAQRGPGLRLVHDAPKFRAVRLPASTRLVLIAFEGVVAGTDFIDNEELTSLLGEYGVGLTPGETRDRFFARSLSEATTFLAERTGRLCPGGFMARLDRRLIDRDRRDLAPMPGIFEMLDRFARAGLDVAIVSHGRPRRMAAVQTLPAFARLETVGPIRMIAPGNEPDGKLSTVCREFGQSPDSTLLIDASCIGIGMARGLSMPAFGFEPQARTPERNALICTGAQTVLADLDAVVS